MRLPRLALAVAVAVASLPRGVLAAADETWPACILHDVTFRVSNPVYADVRHFIRHQDEVRHRTIVFSSDEQVGMALRDEPHDLGEVVLYAVEGSQAQRAGVRAGWIIKEINGKPFSPAERLKDIADDFGKARSSATSLRVKFDVRTFLDCENGTCGRSDRFPAESIESCAEACSRVPDCRWWRFGVDDRDNVCMLQGASKGFSTALGSSIGSNKCVPQAAWSFSSSWPQCVMRNTQLYEEAGQIFADVRPFLRKDEVRHHTISFTADTNFGMILRERPTEAGEVVSEVDAGSQASAAGVRRGWIITEVSGQSFRKGAGVDDANELLAKLKGSAPALEVKFDVRSALDCTDADCSRSDKLPAASVAECASACRQIAGCRWWTYGAEDEDLTCWLRASGKPARATEGSSSGDRACSPPTVSSHTWTRLLWIFVVLAVIIRLRGRFVMLAVSLLQRVAKPGLGTVGVPALELSGSRGMATYGEDEDEHFSLIGRTRKKGGHDYDSTL